MGSHSQATPARSTHIFTFKIFENRKQKIYHYSYASVLLKKLAKIIKQGSAKR